LDDANILFIFELEAMSNEYFIMLFKIEQNIQRVSVFLPNFHLPACYVLI